MWEKRPVLRLTVVRCSDRFPGITACGDVAVNWTLHHCLAGSAKGDKLLSVAKILSVLARKGE